jgi:mycothiol synthase
VPELPLLPEGLTARPMRPDDAAPVAALLAAAEQVDDTGEYPDAADVAEWWTGWGVDLARDGVAVCDETGLLVGYAAAAAPATFRGAYRVYLEGRVRPDRRGQGVGRELLTWQLARGRELHAERHPEVAAQLCVGLWPAVPELERLVRRHGLAPERWYREMERPLTDLPDPTPVDGVALVPFDRQRDDEVRRAHNAAFTEHHGSSERDPASWQRMFTGRRSFRPDLSVLAIENDAVVAYALAYVEEADTRATGTRLIHFGQIGTLPTARGRGLASAAIVEALHRAAARDCQVAGLQVDSDNVTGAVQLYEKLGFTTRRTSVSWARELPPVDG